MNMSSVINQLAVLFLVLSLGYIGNKTKILNAESNRLLSVLVMNITMPCTMISSVTDGSVKATGSEAVIFTLLIIASFALAGIIAWPVPKLLRAPRKDNSVIRCLLLFGNIGFMGYPVIQAIYGDGALFYVTLVNIPFNIMAFTLGIIMMSEKKAKLNLKSLVSPMLIASLVAVIIFAFHMTMPKIIVDTAALVGHMTTPGAMLIIGSTLAEIPIRNVFTDLRIYPIVLLKLIIIPVIIWFILHFFVTNTEILGIIVVESGMPAATIVTMLSLRYGNNENLASKGVFLTTLFSVVTIPLLLNLLFAK